MAKTKAELKAEKAAKKQSIKDKKQKGKKA